MSLCSAAVAGVLPLTELLLPLLSDALVACGPGHAGLLPLLQGTQTEPGLQAAPCRQIS